MTASNEEPSLGERVLDALKALSGQLSSIDQRVSALEGEGPPMQETSVRAASTAPAPEPTETLRIDVDALPGESPADAIRRAMRQYMAASRPGAGRCTDPTCPACNPGAVAPQPMEPLPRDTSSLDFAQVMIATLAPKLIGLLSQKQTASTNALRAVASQLELGRSGDIINVILRFGDDIVFSAPVAVPEGDPQVLEFLIGVPADLGDLPPLDDEGGGGIPREPEPKPIVTPPPVGEPDDLPPVPDYDEPPAAHGGLRVEGEN